MSEKQLAKYSLSDGSNISFLVEVDEPKIMVDTNAKQPAAINAKQPVALFGGKKVFVPEQSFEKVLDEIKPIASTISSKFQALKTPADEVEVKFALKLTAEAGAIFTSVGGEATYEITLKWQNKTLVKDGNV